jgi:hypothetical protein
MTRIRQALAVALVATALCADRLAIAAPVERAHLSVTFRRMAPAVRFDEVHDGEVPAVARPAKTEPQRPRIQQDFSPFQFRLPPPTL